jgi:ribonucleoside-diphosphate reductase alpha chain
VIPFLKVVNDTAVAVNQGGKRKGAVCAYLETWHLDIEEFLELRKNTGDERRRTHDMNTANWIPDLFMKRVHGTRRVDAVLAVGRARPARQIRQTFETAYLGLRSPSRPPARSASSRSCPPCSCGARC